MATVPVTRTFVAGEIVLASHFNTNLRDPINYLLAPPLCQVRQTTLQTLTTSTFSGLTFTTEDVDTTGMHSTVTFTSRLTAVYPGWYRRSGGAGFVANATGARIAQWAVNGTILNSGRTTGPTVAVEIRTMVARDGLTYLNVNDYIELWAWQSSGGNLNTATGSDAASVSLDWVSN